MTITNIVTIDILAKLPLDQITADLVEEVVTDLLEDNYEQEAVTVARFGSSI